MAIIGTGYVNIRAITDKLESDVQKAFAKIKDDITVNINANTTAAQQKISEIIDGIETESIELNIDINKDEADRQINEFKAEHDGSSVDVAVNPMTAYASARFSFLARPRVVEFIANANKAALAQTAATLASLSGGKFLAERLESISKYLLDIGSHVPKLAGVQTAIFGISGAVLALVSNLLTLGGSLAAIVPAALTLPGILAGFAIGGAVSILALKDMSTVLSDLGPQFTLLQDEISADFWAEFEGPIRSLTESLFPQFRESLLDVAEATGSFFGTWATAIEEFVTPEILKFMMDELVASIEIAEGALSPLVEAFTTLGVVGSQYLSSLAEWFVRISDQFNDFIQESMANGDIYDWIDTGIENLMALGRVIREVSRIFYGFYTAAEEAGGSTLVTFALALERVADVVNSEPFQTTLVQIFRGAHDAMDGMLSAIGPLGGALATLGPYIEDAFGTVGDIIGSALTRISEVADNATFGQGMINFFNGILAGVNALQPAMGPLGDLIGTLGGFIGELAANLGGVLAEAVIQLAPVMTGLLDSLEPLLPILSETLIDAIKELAPIFSSLATEVIPPLVDALIEILPSIVPLAAGLADLLVPAIEELGIFITDMIPLWEEVGTTLERAGDYFSTVGGWIDGASAAIEGFFGAGKSINTFFTEGGYTEWSEGVNGAVNDFLGDGAAGFKGFWEDVGTSVSTAWTDMTSSIGIGIGLAVAEFNSFVDDVGTNWNNFWEGVGDVVNIAATAVGTAISDFVTPITTFWNEAWTGFGIIFKSAFEDLAIFLLPITSALSELITSTVDGISIFWTAAWLGITTFFMDVWNGILAFFTPIVVGIGTVISNAMATVEIIWTTVWTNVTTFFTTIWEGIVAYFTPILLNIQTAITTAVTTIQIIWNLVWSTISTFFITIWTGITVAATTFVTNLQTGISTAVTGIQILWNSIWSAVSTFFSTIWATIVSIGTIMVNNIRNNITNTITGIQIIWNSIWTSIGAFFSSAWSGIVAAAAGFVTSVRDRIADAINTVGTIRDRVLSALSGAASWLVGIGQSMIDGMISGIRGAINGVIGAARELADAAVNTVKNILKINSPSKVFIGIGDSVNEGFADGLSHDGPTQSAMTSIVRSLQQTATEGLDNLTFDLPTAKFTSFGEQMGKGLANGISNTVGIVSDATERMTSAAIPDVPGFTQNTSSTRVAVPSTASMGTSQGAAGSTSAAESRGIHAEVNLYPAAHLDENKVGQIAIDHLLWEIRDIT